MFLVLFLTSNGPFVLRPDIRQRKTTVSLGRKSDSDDDSKDEDELVEEDEEEEDSSLPQLEVVPGVSERGSLHRQGSHVRLNDFSPFQICPNSSIVYELIEFIQRGQKAQS